MKTRKKPLNYLSVLKYILLLSGFMIFNKLEPQIFPYSTALFAAAINSGCNVILSFAALIAAAVIQGAYGILPALAVSASFLILVKLVYSRFKIKIKLETAVFTAISLIGFLIIGDTADNVPFEKRAVVTLVSSFLSLVLYISLKALSEKGLKIKFSYDEFASIAAVAVTAGIGICNLVSPFLWKGIVFFTILCACYLLRFGLGTFVSAILGISLAVYYGDIRYVAAVMITGVIADGFSGLSRYAAAVAVPLCDFIVEFIFGVYNGYTLSEFLPVIIAAAFFTVVPPKPFAALKEKLCAFREKQLVRTTINRNRLMLSNRLYELSGVFTEMAWAFSAFRKNGSTPERSKIAMIKEIRINVCKACPCSGQCKKFEYDAEEEISKMVDVGLAKGKISLIDVPSSLGDKCVKLSEMTFGLNKMLSEYRSYALNASNLATGRQLIAEEAEGVSEILRGLALESGALLKYQSKLERTLAGNLLKNGFFASELLVYGEGENTTLCLILAMKEFTVGKLQTVIDKTVGFSMTLTEKTNVTEDKFYLVFKKAPAYDAVFGVSKVTKDGSEISGDTHAVSRISENKFLVALSDGMGSGTDAEAISSVSLSLIESFYKAGMESELILNTVNKLLSINAEDSFTALDVSVIDLKSCSADFIKYGSPYGFIVGDGGVRIIEGNTLPLGILSELKPSVCSAPLSDGDMIVLTTDGISDAFGSSQEVIDFLRKVPAKNPQNLADELLNKAITMADGKKRDDMSVLAVRVYKKRDNMTA